MSGVNPPLPDVVFTTWPSSSWPSIVGTKALMPFTTPITFTSSDHRQSLTWCSQNRPSGRADPGVVAHHVHRAIGLERGVSQRFHRVERRDVGDDAGHVAALVAQLGGGRLDGLEHHVGDHRLHPLVGEAFDQRARSHPRRR